MKNLARTIDRILKVEPALESQLSPLKDKFVRHPSRAMNYWKQLINFLNSKTMLDHPKRDDIKHIVIHTPTAKPLSTFEEVGVNETVVGLIPENIADKIRRHDRASIQIAKRGIVATMTRNIVVTTELVRKQAIMEMELSKIWIAMKDHFHLWDKNGQFFVKTKDGALVLTFQPPQEQKSPSGFMRMDPDMLKGLFGFPPGE